MRFGEVYLSLASLDVFKPDFVLQINATNGGSVIFSFRQIVCETAAPSPPVIDELIPATWMEKLSTQCAAGLTSIDLGDRFQSCSCMI